MTQPTDPAKQAVGVIEDHSDLAQMRSALRERNALIETLVRHLPASVFVKDARTWQYVLWNPVSEAMYGVAREQALGKTDFELFDLEFAQALRRSDEETLAGTGVVEILNRCMTSRTGRQSVVHTRKVAVCDDAGLPRWVVGMSLDVTAARRTEDALRTAEARHQAILESALDAIVVKDEQGRITEWNPSAQRIFGWSREQALGRNVAELIVPERVRRIQRDDRVKAVARFQGRRVETVALHADGHEFAVEMTVQRIDEADQTLYAAFMRDISPRLQAQKQLREQEETYRVLFEGSQDAIMTLDPPAWHFTSGNPAALKMFGLQHEKALACLSAWQVSPATQPDGRPSLDKSLEMIATALRDGKHYFEWTHQRANGERFPSTVLLSRVALGERVFLEATVRDVSAEKRAQEELNQINATLAGQHHLLEQADRAKSEFMANVTHELRTPLNAVIGFAELLKDEVPGPLNAKQAEYVAAILASGQDLLALVQGILEMSRLGAAAGGTLEREALVIGAALAECVAAYRPAAAARGVTLALEVAANVGSAELDAKALRRMLDVLLDNALKFNREGGSVAVSARRLGHWLEIAVSDTGIGIASADLPALFKPLTQLDSGLARKHGGIGLGLALAQHLAELHGGAIQVQSEPGKGSTFTLRLPHGSQQ